MTRYILTLILFSFIQITNSNAAVTVFGDTDATTCYNHAKQGYSSRSSINICLSSLSEKQVDLQLQDLPGWQRDGNSIVKSFEFNDFVEAISFMTQAAFYAEALEHYPEWQNNYNTVKVRLTTDDTGGISSLDIRLAKRMQHIVQPKIF